MKSDTTESVLTLPTTPITPVYVLYSHRFYVLFVFSFLAFNQNLIWLTFSPIARSAEAYYNITDATVDLLLNWGSIIFIPCLPLTYILLNKHTNAGSQNPGNPSPPSQNTSGQNPSAGGPGLKQPADRERLNALAHKLLASALKTNALGGDDLKPWHVKIEYSLLSSYGPFDKRGGTGGSGRGRTVIAVGGGTASMSHGTVEEWYAARYQWSRTYASDMDTWNGSQWRVSHTERYELRPKHMDFAAELLNLRVTRPVINPMYQAAMVPAEAMLAVSRLSAGDGQNFNCVSVTNPNSLGPNRAVASWIMPTMCFDSDVRLRLVSSGDTAVQFMDFQPFQGRAVARTVRVLVRGQLDSEMKITTLEAFDPGTNGAVLKPPAEAVLQPYVIEDGDPPLVSVFEQGTTIPLLGDGTPFRGTLTVAAIVHKDGSVKPLPTPAGPLQGVLDAMSIAVSRWKYKPYEIDGQAVEVRVNIPYMVDGKPFVPSYQRAGQAQGTFTP